MIVTIKNRTNKTLYNYLANSFVITCGEAHVYFVPTAKFVTSGTSGDVGVNVGALANAAGIGGTLGTIASGVTVGGSTTKQNTTKTFSQRVIAIPPIFQRILKNKKRGGKRDQKMEGICWNRHPPNDSL